MHCTLYYPLPSSCDWELMPMPKMHDPLLLNINLNSRGLRIFARGIICMCPLRMRCSWGITRQVIGATMRCAVRL